MNLNTILLGIAICIVIAIFIGVYHYSYKFSNVTRALNIIEKFQTQPTSTITFKSICGDTIIPNNITGKIPFPNSDDYHIININNIPTNMYNLEKITISFMTQSGNDEKVYTGSELEEIKTDPNTYTLKKTLQENTKYILKIKSATSELKHQFTTDYNIFTYNPKLNNETITTNTEASKYLFIGIKKKEDPIYVYQLEDTDTNILNASDGNYTYNLEIPNFNNYISAVITKLKMENNQCIESEYNELSKYIPYKFDALLTVNRVKDPYPLETVIVPSIKCIPTNNCNIIMRNLRKNTEYKIKIRLIYFKAGSQSNYRSSPMIQWSFNTGESGDNFFETLDQINKLLYTVKNANINAELFNKEQAVQNDRLMAIENDYISKIQPLFT